VLTFPSTFYIWQHAASATAGRRHLGDFAASASDACCARRARVVSMMPQLQGDVARVRPLLPLGQCAAPDTAQRNAGGQPMSSRWSTASRSSHLFRFDTTPPLVIASAHYNVSPMSSAYGRTAWRTQPCTTPYEIFIQIDRDTARRASSTSRVGNSGGSVERERKGAGAQRWGAGGRPHAPNACPIGSRLLSSQNQQRKTKTNGPCDGTQSRPSTRASAGE
jgi:hypothetical protein